MSEMGQGRGTEAAHSASVGNGGLDPKVGGALSYLLAGGIGGLIMYRTQAHHEVRFHAAQSMLITIAVLVLYVAMWVIGALFLAVPGFGWLGSLVHFLVAVPLAIAAVVLWVYLCIKGFQLEHRRVPVLGDMAEAWVTESSAD